MSYYELLLQALYHQVELHKWSLARLHSKAKSMVTAGTAALSVITVGLSGFATLLARADLDHAALLESLFGGLAHYMVAAAIAGIVSIIASTVVSVLALKGCQLHQILTTDDFEYVSRDGPPGGAGKSRGMSEKDLSERLLGNIHSSVKTLEECNGRVAPKVHAGQVLLLVGIALISIIPLVALANLLLG